MRPEERIGALERDLGKLEAVVESLVSGMEKEHKAMKESRQEDRDSLRRLGEKMESTVSGLAEEMKKLAEKSSKIDSLILNNQSKALGAIDAGRWVVTLVLSLAGLLIAYQAGQNNSNDKKYQREGTEKIALQVTKGQ